MQALFDKISYMPYNITIPINFYNMKGLIKMLEIEEIAKELNTVREEKNRLARREKELVAELYKRVFDKNSYKPEEVETTDYILLKYPAFRGERYKVDEVRKLAMKYHRKLITTERVYKANELALKELLADGLLTEEEFDALKILSNRINISIR